MARFRMSIRTMMWVVIVAAIDLKMVEFLSHMHSPNAFRVAVIFVTLLNVVIFGGIGLWRAARFP